MSVMQLQQRVLGPETVVDYSTLIMQSYPAYAIQHEPFVGFKIRCRDTQTNPYHGEYRMQQIDAFLQQTRCLMDTGVILRASDFQTPDGIWVITMPVPRSQIVDILGKLFHVLAILEKQLGIVMTGTGYEINVSGRCLPYEVETVIGSLQIPTDYLSMLIPPVKSAFRYGYLYRINDVYACFRTRWNMGNRSANQMQEALMLLSQLIVSIFH